MAVYQNDRKEICYEDILAVFYIQVRCFGGSFPQIRHLVIDEMQDYNVFQFAVLKGCLRVQRRSLAIRTRCF